MYSYFHLHSDLFLQSFCKYCNEINIRGEHKGAHTISSADSLLWRPTGIISQDHRPQGWTSPISHPADLSFLVGNYSVLEVFQKVLGLTFCASSDKVSELAFHRMFAVLPSEATVVLGMRCEARRRTEVPIPDIFGVNTVRSRRKPVAAGHPQAPELICVALQHRAGLTSLSRAFTFPISSFEKII